MEHIVEGLTQSEKPQGAWLVAFTDGETLEVGVDLIADYSIYAGREYDDEEYARLRHAARVRKARRKAVDIVGYGMLSKRELLAKLRTRGFEEDEAAEAADALERAGLLDDVEYAASVVRRCVRKGCGEGRIKNELYRRGVPRELWDDALSDGLPPAEDAIGALLTKLLHGKTPDDKELRRVEAKLYRRGFSHGDIRRAVSEYLDADAGYDDDMEEYYDDDRRYDE